MVEKFDFCEQIFQLPLFGVVVKEDYFDFISAVIEKSVGDKELQKRLFLNLCRFVDFFGCSNVNFGAFPDFIEKMEKNCGEIRSLTDDWPIVCSFSHIENSGATGRRSLSQRVLKTLLIHLNDDPESFDDRMQFLLQLTAAKFSVEKEAEFGEKVAEFGEESLCQNFCNAMLKFPNSIFVLEAAYSILSLAENFVWNENLSSLLCQNLASANKKIRSISMKIMQLFYKSNEAVGIMIDLFLESDEINADIQNYREKLRILRKISWNESRELISKLPDSLRMMPLLFLTSQIYTNFSLLWDSVDELIASYLIGIPIEEIWPIFSNVLEKANVECKSKRI